MKAIFKREFRSNMTSMYGPIFLVFMFLAFGISMLIGNILYMSPQIEGSLASMSIIFVIAIPALTMRSMAEDKRMGTDKFLITLPLRVSSVIFGKFLSLLAIFAIPVSVMCVMPLVFSTMGQVALLQSYTSILAFFLLGAALISICMYINSLTESQFIATVLSVGAMLLIFLSDTIAYLLPTSELASFIALLVLCLVAAAVAFVVSKNILVTACTAAVLVIGTSVCYIFFTEAFEGLASTVLIFLSPFTRFYYFTYGIFDLTSIAYYIAIIVFFTYLSVVSLDKKRWG